MFKERNFMSLNKVIAGLVLVVGLFLSLGPARADQQELQLGYVFNSWGSNSLFHGTEQRIPLSYYLSSPNLTLSLNTAFVAGDYVEDANAGAGIVGSEYK